MTTDRRSNGNVAAWLIGGIAAGLLGSRLAPPLMAMVQGQRRVRAGNDPFELLIDDHRKLLAMLDDMVITPANSRLSRLKMFLMFKRTLGKHALAEEDVVYPLLHDKARDPEKSKHLYEEHADMKILLFQMEEAVMNGTEWERQVEMIRDLIAEHIHEEETVVFPKLREMMREQMPRVSGQIRREEALVL